MVIPQRILSIFELNEYVRRTLASDPMLSDVRIRGEISNFKRYSSGHWYFSVKDEKARLSCVMFRQNNFAVSKIPKDGDAVILYGSAALYTKDGNYQFYVEDIQQDGVGVLYQRFIELKNKLQKEGLFDSANKQPIPLLPTKVGIITSRTGAVIHDIQIVAERRFSSIPLVLYPVKVQGEGAAEEMCEGIKFMDMQDEIDVIIIGRGGGSLEDLWAFNDINLAYAVNACKTPVISAVGHETDFTIVDFVADMRAATPSQAAEIAIPDRKMLLSQLFRTMDQMRNMTALKMYDEQRRLSNLSTRFMRLHPGVMFENQTNTLKTLRQRLFSQLKIGETALLTDKSRVEALHLRRMASANKRLTEVSERLGTLKAKLNALSPKAVLERGYSLVYMNSKVISNINHLKYGDVIGIKLSNGAAQASILSIEKRKTE